MSTVFENMKDIKLNLENTPKKIRNYPSLRYEIDSCSWPEKHPRLK